MYQKLRSLIRIIGVVMFVAAIFMLVRFEMEKHQQLKYIEGQTTLSITQIRLLRTALYEENKELKNQMDSLASDVAEQNLQTRNKLDSVKISPADPIDKKQVTKTNIDIAAFKADVAAAVPRLIAACENGALTADSLPATANMTVGIVVAGNISAECGPTGSGLFSITTSPVRADVINACGFAIITNEGITYSIPD
jgi:hypothetical protein